MYISLSTYFSRFAPSEDSRSLIRIFTGCILDNQGSKVNANNKDSANANATHIFSANTISIYAIFNDQSFNDTLIKGIVSFEHLGPDKYA